MGIHYPADVNLFELVEIEDPECAPEDKKLIQMVSDRIGHEFIATAEDDLTLKVIFDLEQMIGREIKWLTGPTYDEILRTKYEFGGTPNRLPSWARRYCTVRMKLIPSFHYCFNYLFTHVNDQVEMRIGYRAGEQHRKVKYIKRKNDYIKYPLSCNNYGEGQQQHTMLKWRTGTFPLIDNLVYHSDILRWADGTALVFPKESNCVGCFHKDPVSLKLQWKVNRKKMEWFARQENLGKGTWHDTKLRYDRIDQMDFPMPLDFSMGGKCDSGGCTD
jgi:hypothetical protein